LAVLAREKTYDRSRLMKRASVARRKGKHKKAIGLYRQVLEVEPENQEIHQKIAPLLAQTKQAQEAMASYRKATEGLVRQGFSAKAIGLLRSATGYLPREIWLWQGIAELEERRDRTPDAIEALLEGTRHFRSRKLRPDAIKLLIQARKLDRDDFRVSYDLACLLAKSGGRRQALRLLDELVAGPHSRHLRRVRAKQFRLAPSPASAWRFARSLFVGR